MRISDWSSDVCSSDLTAVIAPHDQTGILPRIATDKIARIGNFAFVRDRQPGTGEYSLHFQIEDFLIVMNAKRNLSPFKIDQFAYGCAVGKPWRNCVRFDCLQHAHVHAPTPQRSEEHTSELQSLMRISYAVFCLKKKKYTHM